MRVLCPYMVQSFRTVTHVHGGLLPFPLFPGASGTEVQTWLGLPLNGIDHRSIDRPSLGDRCTPVVHIMRPRTQRSPVLSTLPTHGFTTDGLFYPPRGWPEFLQGHPRGHTASAVTFEGAPRRLWGERRGRLASHGELLANCRCRARQSA